MPDVLVKERLLKKIEKTLEELLEREQWKTEEETAAYFGKSVKTIQNNVHTGKIPPSAYKTTVFGSRMYLTSKMFHE